MRISPTRAQNRRAEALWRAEAARKERLGQEGEALAFRSGSGPPRVLSLADWGENGHFTTHRWFIEGKMSFRIQVSNPRVTGSFSPDDQDLIMATETIFQSRTEFAVMIWNHSLIPLDYKYEVGSLLADAILILDALREPGPGAYQMQWSSSSIRAHWDLRWDALGELVVNARWDAVPRSDLGALARYGPVRMPKHEFVWEWRELFGRVLRALDQAGYQDSQIRGLADLRRVYSQIPKSGFYYRELAWGPRPLRDEDAFDLSPESAG